MRRSLDAMGFSLAQLQDLWPQRLSVFLIGHWDSPFWSRAGVRLHWGKGSGGAILQLRGPVQGPGDHVPLPHINERKHGSRSRL